MLDAFVGRLARTGSLAAVALILAGGSMASVDPAGLGALTVSMLRGEDGFQGRQITVNVAQHRHSDHLLYDCFVMPVGFRRISSFLEH